MKGIVQADKKIDERKSKLIFFTMLSHIVTDVDKLLSGKIWVSGRVPEWLMAETANLSIHGFESHLGLREFRLLG